MARLERAAVVIAGAGVAALEAALALRALAADVVRVELLAPEAHFWYRPLAVAEPFELGEARRFELGELAAAAGATLSPGTLVAVDARGRLAHTAAGAALPYEALLIACGAVPKPAVAGAITFRGPADIEKIRRLLDEIAAGEVRRIVFAAPWGAVWNLPIYELALLTAAHIAKSSIGGVELALVTPEEEPLQLFGRAASDAVRSLLDARGVALHTSAYPGDLSDGALRLLPGGALAADRVVALPRLQGQRIDGIPQTVDGFVPVDEHGRVTALEHVYAAGDITSFPVKQGGIAAQQADAAAEAIAAAFGGNVRPLPFRPVLRGLLLTGAEPRYLRQQLTGGAGDTSLATPEPLWWPPAKIVGRYLAPLLAAFAGTEPTQEQPDRPDAVRVEVELWDSDIDRLTSPPTAAVGAARGQGGRTVADVMTAEPLVVAPEDTLGEVAERMRERDVASALVGDYGRLIGILTARDLLDAVAGRVHSSEARVREWMTAEPVTVSRKTTLEAAVLLMTECGIHHLPVVEDERPVGMIGMRDVADRR